MQQARRRKWSSECKHGSLVIVASVCLHCLLLIALYNFPSSSNCCPTQPPRSRFLVHGHRILSVSLYTHRRMTDE